MAPDADAGSFRDPRGRVYIAGNRVFRTVFAPAVEDFEFVTSTGLYEKLASEGRLVGHRQVDQGELPGLDPQPRYLLEHPKLPFISHPYEWCFSALQSAALLHLDIQLEALACGVNLSDATAFNIGVNAGPDAGQTIEHTHLHLIPRYPGDAEDPRGGVRWVIPNKARYWTD